ncbi:hypothetical protein amyaer_3498 [Microcystis aeruginosa NIES-2481]|nr:hypothetical protein amyaer_3498 [Microcystis aeruginosa NIES-2481]
MPRVILPAFFSPLPQPRPRDAAVDFSGCTHVYHNIYL